VISDVQFHVPIDRDLAEVQHQVAEGSAEDRPSPMATGFPAAEDCPRPGVLGRYSVALDSTRNHEFS
jgi:hypothetical protein